MQDLKMSVKIGEVQADIDEPGILRSNFSKDNDSTTNLNGSMTKLKNKTDSSSTVSQPHQEPSSPEPESSLKNESDVKIQDSNKKLKRKFPEQKKSTILNERGYFKKDDDQEEDLQFIQKENQESTIIEDFDTRFRFRIFVQFFFYHLVIMLLLGPFCLPFFYFKPGQILLYNLSFLGKYSVTAYINYFMNLVNLVLYFTFLPSNVFFYADIVYFFFFLLLRMSIIANKYATFNQENLKSLQTQLWPHHEIVAQFYLGEWKEQTNKMIYDQITFIINKHQIEVGMFYLNFLSDPGQHLADQINENVLALSEYHPKNSQLDSFQPDPITLTEVDFQNQVIFFGYGLFQEYIDYFEQQHQNIMRNLSYFSTLVTITRGFIPSIFRVSRGIGFFGQEWYQIVIITLNFIFTCGVYNFLLIYLNQTVHDLRRKKFLLDQCSLLISPRKLQSLDLKQILPTIDIFCHLNLKAWEILRKVVYEYGNIYFVRVQAIKVLMGFILFTGLIVVFLNVYDVIQIETPFVVLIFIDSLYLLIIVLYLMKYAADINKTFETQLNIIYENKLIIKQIKRGADVYFGDEFKSKKYIYRYAIRKLQTMFDSKPKVINHLNSLIEEYNEMLINIEYEAQVNGFKIFGILINWGLINSLILSAIGAIFALAYQMISKQ